MRPSASTWFRRLCHIDSRAVVLATSAGWLIACGGGTNPGDTGAPADAGGDMAVIGDGSDGPCNDLDAGNRGGILPMATGDPPPTPMGGTIVDGHYILMTQLEYNLPLPDGGAAPDGFTFTIPDTSLRGDLIVANGTLELFVELFSQGHYETRLSAGYIVSGTSLQLTPTCETGDPVIALDTVPYDADPMHITLYRTAGPTTPTSYTFLLQ